jgi:methionyl-tRNA synthetase
MTALEALDVYPSDSLRFHLLGNGPEKKDTNFSPDEMVATHNNEILNKFGNLVNRTLKFKGLEVLPAGKMDEEMLALIKDTYSKVGDLIEKLEFREAVREIMILVENANKYYDTREPWKQRKEDEEAFNDTIYTCAVIIANLSNLFEPIMPEACAKLRGYLKLENPSWNVIQEVKAGTSLEGIEPLFARL